MKHKSAMTWKKLFEITKDYHNQMSAYVIDVGARDIETSNVRPFIEADYRCLLVEPNPQQVAIIEQEMEQLKQHTWLAPVAIAEENSIIDFMVSPNIGHSRIPNENFDRNKWQTKGQKLIKVECWTFAKLLEEYPAWVDADVVSIDTEGYSTIVLKSMFKTELRPMFIMIEHWNDSLIMKEQAELMERENYIVFGKTNQDFIWKKDDIN